MHSTEFRLVAHELAIGTGTIALGVIVWGLGFLRFRAGDRATTETDPRIPVAIVRAVATAVSLVAVGAAFIAALPAR